MSNDVNNFLYGNKKLTFLNFYFYLLNFIKIYK